MKVYELMSLLSQAEAGTEVTAVVCLSPSVMLSIKPKWCELIAKGRKTIEFRKSKPNLETPFKCYIYCTKDKGISFWTGKQYAYADDKSHNLFDVYGNGKVIGEFLCDYILKITPDTYGHHEYFISDDDLNASCLTTNDLWEYGSGKTLCGWHISDLVIYDEPRELSEYKISRPPQSWCYIEEAAA